MNTLKPLAAAFLILTSSASAGTADRPTLLGGGGFSMTSDNGGYSNPLSFANMTGSGPIPDSSFVCSSVDNAHIPYASCTEVQLADRKRFNGECPAKSTACKEYLQRQLSGNNPAGTIAAFTPPPDTEWASPTCNFIPCATKAMVDQQKKSLASELGDIPRQSPVPGDADFIGPVQDTPNQQFTPNFSAKSAPISAPPAASAADVKRAFEEAQASYGDKAVDLGNNTYGILDEKGDGMSICGPTGCARGNQADHKDKIQQARAEQFAFNNNSNTPPGGNAGNNKASGQTSGGTPPPAEDNDDSGSTGSGSGLGRGFAADQASISGAGGGSSSSGSSAGASSGDGKGYIAVKPSEMQPIGSIQITHTALLKTEADINGAQRAFTNGQNGFAAPNDDTGSAAGDPPISPEHLGKIQAVANDGSAPK